MKYDYEIEIDNLRQQLAEVTRERDVAYEWIKARPEREIAFRHDTQQFAESALSPPERSQT